eukprot:Rmarinus@m.15726
MIKVIKWMKQKIASSQLLLSTASQLELSTASNTFRICRNTRFLRVRNVYLLLSKWSRKLSLSGRPVRESTFLSNQVTSHMIQLQNAVEVSRNHLLSANGENFTFRVLQCSRALVQAWTTCLSKLDRDSKRFKEAGVACMAVDHEKAEPEIIAAALRLGGNEHAEQVLFHSLPRNLESKRLALYTTLQPCNWCAGSISQYGIFNELFYIWEDRNYPLAQEALFFATNTGPFPWHVGDFAMPDGTKFPTSESMTMYQNENWKRVNNQWAPSSGMHYSPTFSERMIPNLTAEERKLVDKILPLLQGCLERGKET